MSRNHKTPHQAQQSMDEFKLLSELLAAPAGVETTKGKRKRVSIVEMLLMILRKKATQGHAPSYQVLEQEKHRGPQLEAQLKEVMTEPDPDREQVPYGDVVQVPFGVDRDEYIADVFRGMHRERKEHYTRVSEEAVRLAMAKKPPSQN